MARREAGLLRYGIYTLVALVAGGGMLFAWHQVDQFLISDPRFVLSMPDDEEPSSIHIEGVRHASRERIYEVFRREPARSVYLLPLAERRRNLLALEWVKEASVSRIWPNQIAVRITERKPVAFVHLARENSGDAPVMMIDDEGVLLALHNSARFKLPVITGLRRDQTESDREGRVRRMLKMQTEIGPQMERISEIDLADADNVKITYPMGDRAMILYLGHNSYARRLKKFLDNYDEVRKRLPGARALDLRLDDRITSVVDESQVPVPTIEPVTGAPNGE